MVKTAPLTYCAATVCSRRPSVRAVTNATALTPFRG